ncbi:MAG: hypothetical protein Q4A92_08320 [Corynebacterium sp.]|nr:hypothetical protein [Corynebacterium sp.]
MANRAYLYAERPREDGTSDIISVGEFRSTTPFAYMLLCSVNTEQLPSKIFNDLEPDDDGGVCGPTAFRGLFPEGREALLQFMEKFAEVNSNNLYLPEDTLAEEFASTRKELLDERFAGCTHFWLEPFETFALVSFTAEDVTYQADSLRARLEHSDAEQASILEMWERGDFDQYSSAQEFFNTLGFGSWSDILYFQFEKLED